MPPKSKSNSSKERKVIDKDAWRSELESVVINDDRSWCMVIMMVETLSDHSQCVSMFNEAAENDKRKPIYTLSRQSTINSVRTLAKSDPDKCPSMQGICHYANEVLNRDNEILPAWLMARVIKYLTHRVKVEVESRMRKPDVDREVRTGQTTGDFDLGEGSKQKGAEKSQLREREDEGSRGKGYTRDAPMGSPDLYVVLSGFYDSTLPLELIKVGIPLICILEIKQPEEAVERDDGNGSIGARLTLNEDISRIIDEDFTSEADIREFWTNFEKSYNDWKTIYDYCGLMRRTLCPPKILSTSPDRDGLEREELMTIVYDTVSCAVYDLCRIYRQHVSYLRGMRLQPNLVEQRVENRNTKRYTMFLDAIPVECSSVPIVLHALLIQVEADVSSTVNASLSNENVEEFVDEKVVPSRKTSANENSTSNTRTEKLVRMNQKYDLFSSIERSSLVREPKLILHGDTLNASTYHLYIDPEETDVHQLAVVGENVLRNSRIVRFWNNVEDVLEDNATKYSYHINRISRCFDRQPMDDQSVRHYIHLLLLDKMIRGHEGLLGSKKDAKSNRSLSFPDGRILKTKRSRKGNLSETPIISQTTENSLFSDDVGPSRYRSDCIIDYSRTMSETFECPALLRLMDIRDTIRPGLCKSKEERNKGQTFLREFDAVQLLSSEVFLQTVHDCLRNFDEIEYEYFGPTDSILLYFYDVCETERVMERAYSANIRTPVGLRDFNEYVVAEEQDWMRQEDARHEVELRKIAEEQLKTTDTNASVPTNLYTNDLTLPSSPKTKRKDKGGKGGKGGKEKKEPSTRDKSSKDKERGRRSSDLKSSFSPLVRCALENEPYEFIGYDLGNCRTQVSGTDKTFLSIDGTLIRVRREEWLYQKTELRIAINLSECELILYSAITSQRSTMETFPFHLLTKEGIILAFSKTPAVTDLSNELPIPGFDFRASWPSGLIVEPIVGDGPENPYYIGQRYVSKGPECTDIVRESYRKFLRNGTVLIFFDDDTVTVLRPNGTVVEYVAFQKTKNSEFKRSTDNTPRADRSRSSRATVTSKTKRLSSITGSRPRGLSNDESLHKKMPLIEEQLETNRSLSMGDGTRLRVSQYRVLEPDGRHYEILHGRIVRELNRSLVRTTSDYEVDEKFTRRADGTDTLINSDGQMIVSFPDGTRITTGYVVEENPVICDWSEDEFRRLFSFERSSQTGKGSWISSNSSRSKSYVDTNRMTDDAFVSVLLTCRMEHKNYATVTYDQSNVNCTLLMPGNVKVMITSNGLYDVIVNSRVTLQVRETSLTYSNKICTTCGGTSTSVYKFVCSGSNPEEESSQHPLLRTTDVFGNVFEVDHDGTTRYQSSRQILGLNEVRNGAEVEKRRNEDAEDAEDRVDKDDELKNTTRCLPKGFVPRNRYRIFAMNRDLTAYEYVRRSIRMEEEKEARSNDDSSLLLHQVPARPGLNYRVTLTPLNPKTISKAWIQAYKTPRVRSTNYDRTDVPRSTYAIPYDWLFPYGKNGNGIRVNTWNTSFGQRAEHSMPDRLRIRILREIQLDDEDPIVDLQKALGRYWQRVINEFEKYRSYRPKDERTSEERNIENWLEELALGRKKTMDVETYLRGLAKNRIEPRRASTTTRRCRLDRFFEERLSKREEVTWYRKYMREKIYIPYFNDFPGACFLWVKECVETALKTITSVDSSVSDFSEESNETSTDRYSTNNSESLSQGPIDESFKYDESARIQLES